MSNYLPDKDTALLAWANNFVTVATANLSTLGLTSGDIANISGGASDFGDGLDGVTTAKAAYESAVGAKDDFRQYLEGLVRPVVKRIQALEGVPDSLKLQLGITAGTGVVNRTPPVQPAALLATPQADGTNALKWHKAGNKPTTQYAVLAKPLTDGASLTAETGWTMVGLTTASRFRHNGVTPGVPMAYKVMAVRAGNASVPSIPATVYAS